MQVAVDEIFMSTSSDCFFVVTGGASRRFLGPGRAGFHVSCKELHPEHVGDVRGPALPHGSAVRPHHQARDAAVEGQVERGYRAGEVPFNSPCRAKSPSHPTRRSLSWAREGHWGWKRKLDGGGRVFRLVLCVHFRGTTDGHIGTQF